MPVTAVSAGEEQSHLTLVRMEERQACLTFKKHHEQISGVDEWSRKSGRSCHFCQCFVFLLLANMADWYHTTSQMIRQNQNPINLDGTGRA